MQQWGTYTCGRVLGVATRPIVLFLANNYLGQSAAEGVAIVFLASAVALAGIAADPHRRFYARLFNPGSGINGVPFYVYAASVGVLMVLASVVVFVIGYRFSASLGLASAGILYYLSEKIADEVLRLRLFEQEFSRWGIAVIARSTLQLFGLAALLAALGAQAPAWLAVLVLAAGNLAVFVPQLPLEAGHALLRSRTAAKLLVRAARSLYENRILWALALASACVAYLDRLVAMVVDKSILPVFMLVVMAFSVVQLAVDFFYVSRHRREFLDQAVSIKSAFGSRGLLGTLASGVAAAALLALAVLHYSKNGAAFPFAWVLIIAALQSCLAVVEIPRQILYWKHYLGAILRIELGFWALIAISLATARSFELSLTGLLALVLACAVARTAAFVALAARSDAALYNAPA